MIINHTHKFVFVHVPKAAGTAVASMLRPLSTYRDIEIGTGPLGQAMQSTYGRHYGLRKHATAYQIREVMGEEDWASYFTFGFARNPFSRLQSVFHFLKSWDKLPEAEARKLAQFDTFEQFLESDIWETGFGPSGIYRRQTAWLGRIDHHHTLIVDFVGRVEHLDADMARIAERIGGGVQFEAIQKANVTPKYDKSVTWSEDAIARVVERYGPDFDMLGYSRRPEDR